MKGQGSSSPYVVSELTLVATVSFHQPPLLDEQETEAVLCQLWTINPVPESSTDPRSTHDKARVRRAKRAGVESSMDIWGAESSLCLLIRSSHLFILRN